MKVFYILFVLFVGTCLAQQTKSSAKLSEQSVQVELRSNTIVQLNSFNGTVTINNKILNDPICLTAREQEIILLTAERFRFFSLPDTVHQQPDVTIAGNTGIHILRIKTGNRDKSIVWFEPPNKSFKYYKLLMDLQDLIVDIIASKPEYYAILHQ